MIEVGGVKIRCLAEIIILFASAILMAIVIVNIPEKSFEMVGLLATGALLYFIFVQLLSVVYLILVRRDK